MSKFDHPVFAGKPIATDREPPIKSCEFIGNHEPHWWNETPHVPDYLGAEYLCGGTPVKVIDIHDARSKRANN